MLISAVQQNDSVIHISIYIHTLTHVLFKIFFSLISPDSSVDKESACKAEEPSLIPGSGRSAGEGIGYPLQLVKNLPAMQKTWVQSLNLEDPLEKGKATHSSILA